MLQFNRRHVIGIAAALVLSGCMTVTTGQPGTPAVETAYHGVPESRRSAQSATASLSREVFTSGFQEIHDIYFEDVDLGVLTLDGLRGLSSIDDRITAERRDGRLSVEHRSAEVGNYDEPSRRDARGWAQLTFTAIEDIQARSESLRQSPAEDVYEAVFEAITSDLDSYSRYIGAERARGERARRDGYGGIGIRLGTDDLDRPIAEQIFREGPAASAGIPEGSRFLEVDGQDVQSMRPAALADTLRGRINTSVTITLQLTGDRLQTYQLRRQRVIPNVVHAEHQDGIGVLAVEGFNAATTQHIREGVVSLLEGMGPSAKGVILDLRGNPGGLLGQSVAVADLFIPRGEIIQTRGRHPDSFQAYPAESQDILNGLPLVVLVDGRSASGAEVVAAALQDSGRAVVIGASSFGKGSVQKVSPLPNDGELFLTWSQIYTPLGYNLHRQGVMPTICTANEPEDASDIVRRFAQGELTIPAGLSTWRSSAPEDETALDLLRSACPWRSSDAEVDLAVAEMILNDSALYKKAIDSARAVAGVMEWAEIPRESLSQ